MSGYQLKFCYKNLTKRKFFKFDCKDLILNFSLVGHVDDFLSLYNGAVFVLCIVNLTLILYIMIWESDIFQVQMANGQSDSCRLRFIQRYNWCVCGNMKPSFFNESLQQSFQRWFRFRSARKDFPHLVGDLIQQWHTSVNMYTKRGLRTNCFLWWLMFL